MDEVKEYGNGEIVVVWQPAKCTHSAKCVLGLPSVFNTKARPWVNMAAAETERIKRQVERCPSGALTWRPAADQPE
jgi:putative redox protein